MEYTVFFILIITFCASLFRSTLGFGESLFAVPLFLLFLPLEIAVPLSVLISIVIALIIVIQDHSKIYFKSAKWLILSALPGIPIGLMILLYADENLVKVGLGILIIAYSVYALLANNNSKSQKSDTYLLFICGFLSGVFGGAYGLNGPPLVVYGNIRKWNPQYFRATLQAYFLPVSLVGALAFYSKGLITTEVSHYFLISLFSAIPAVFLGRYLNRKLKEESFLKYAYWGLIMISMILVIHSFYKMK